VGTGLDKRGLDDTSEACMITLRPYQKDAVESIIAQFDAGVHSTLLAASTGSGKTECFLAWLSLSMEHNDRALVIAHRKELIDQPFQRIMDHWQSLGIPGIVMAGRNEVSQDVTIATVQTLNSNGRLDNILKHGPITHLVTDEAHHSTAKTYRNVYDRLREASPDLLHLGVTATPNRTDKDGLSQVYQTVAYRASIPSMIKAGALCPFTAYGVKLPVTVEDDDFRDDDKMGDILSLRNAEEVVIETWKEHAEDRPTIAFTASVAQAHSLAAHFREYGYRFMAVDGTTKKDLRSQIVRDFLAGRIQGLVNCGIFTEGTDLPMASCLLQVRPTKSDLLYVQIVGRVLRTYPGKDMALILDFVPAGARDMILAGDLLGRPKEEKKVIDKAEGKTILSVFGINREGNGIDGDPDEVILEVLDYLTRGTSLAWTFDGDVASAGVAQGLALACVMPDKVAQERIVKAQVIRQGGEWHESWQPTYERLRNLAQYQLYKVEGYRATCLGVFEDWESCSEVAETFAGKVAETFRQVGRGYEKGASGAGDHALLCAAGVGDVKERIMTTALFNAESMEIVMESVHVGMGLLYLMDSITGKDWSRGSVPRGDLDRIAQQLGFSDASLVWKLVEGERQLKEDRARDMYEGMDW
jgi:superfamily II DNA or RNA helicase